MIQELTCTIENVSFGIWVDKCFTWLHSHEWLKQESEHQFGEDIFTNKQLGLSVTIKNKEFDVAKNAQLLELNVQNLLNYDRQVKVFIRERQETETDTVRFFAPSIKAIVKTEKAHFYLMNGLFANKGISQYNTDFKEDFLTQNGQLSIQPFSFRSHASIFSLEGELAANETVPGYVWLCSGLSEAEVVHYNHLIQLMIFSNKLSTKLFS